MKGKTEDGQFLDEIIFEAVETVKVGDATLRLEGSCGYTQKYKAIEQKVTATVRLLFKPNWEPSSDTVMHLMRKRKRFKDDKEKPKAMEVAREQWIPKIMTYFEDFKKLRPKKL